MINEACVTGLWTQLRQIRQFANSPPASTKIAPRNDHICCSVVVLTMMKDGTEVEIVGGTYKGRRATFIKHVGNVSVLLELKNSQQRIRIRSWNIAIASGDTSSSQQQQERSRESPLPEVNTSRDSKNQTLNEIIISLNKVNKALITLNEEVSQLTDKIRQISLSDRENGE